MTPLPPRLSISNPPVHLPSARLSEPIWAAAAAIAAVGSAMIANGGERILITVGFSITSVRYSLLFII